MKVSDRQAAALAGHVSRNGDFGTPRRSIAIDKVPAAGQSLSPDLHDSGLRLKLADFSTFEATVL
ncbi:hypothetical protein [Pseudopontixanthobacter vadosimaris]|uniref:hypothetical protein n=1 Tax=Pseudopontixanthobacter vadosimaris TaxID=2726450 RepID=UPI001474EB75|nr:hypothetical protein [Pseudopontixanthobacter vadosimaris]